MKSILGGLAVNEYCDAQLAAMGASVLAAAMLLEEALTLENCARDIRLIRELESDEQAAFTSLLRRLADKAAVSVAPDRTIEVGSALLSALELIRRAAEMLDLRHVPDASVALRALAGNLTVAAGPLVDLTMSTEPNPRLQACVDEIESAASNADEIYAEQVGRLLHGAEFLDAFRTVELLRILLETHHACRDAARRFQYAIEAAS